MPVNCFHARIVSGKQSLEKPRKKGERFPVRLVLLLAPCKDRHSLSNVAIYSLPLPQRAAAFTLAAGRAFSISW